MRLKIALLLLFSLINVSCSLLAPTRTCDDVNGEFWRGLVLQPNTPQSIQDQIASRYKLPLDQVSITLYKDGNAQLVWSTDQVERTIWLQGSNVVGGTSHFKGLPPSVELVTKCLGTPDYYSAKYQREGQESFRNLLTADLYFVHQGISATIFEHASGSNPPPLSNSTPVSDFLFRPVSSPEETMNLLTYIETTEERQKIKPWPGKWEDIVVEIDSSLR